MPTLPNLLALRGDQLRPMTEVESRDMIDLLFADIVDTPQPLTWFDTGLGVDFDALPFGLRVIVQRLRLTDFLYSPRAILFASILSRTPGVAVIWAYALYVASRDGEPLTLDAMTFTPTAPFAFGIPTEEAYHQLWDEQKQRGAPLGNLLDAAQTWGVESLADANV